MSIRAECFCNVFSISKRIFPTEFFFCFAITGTGTCELDSNLKYFTVLSTKKLNDMCAGNALRILFSRNHWSFWNTFSLFLTCCPTPRMTSWFNFSNVYPNFLQHATYSKACCDHCWVLSGFLSFRICSKNFCRSPHCLVLRTHIPVWDSSIGNWNVLSYVRVFSLLHGNRNIFFMGTEGFLCIC